MQSALASITDANATNPYVIYVAPGVYSVAQTIVMKEYVHIVGSGPDATILKGSIVSTFLTNSAIINGENNASLRSLSIENRAEEMVEAKQFMPMPML